jgi:hypothetical protein
MEQEVVKLRRRVVCHIWETFKKEATMRRLAEALGIPMATFYRDLRMGKTVKEKIKKVGT